MENGTLVTGNEEVYKAYESKRNKERYLKRKRNEHVAMSIDDEKAAFALRSDTDIENEVEKRVRIQLMRNALRKLPKAERQLINEYFLEDIPLRRLAKKYGVSHTFIYGRINEILQKLRDDILDKE